MEIVEGDDLAPGHPQPRAGHEPAQRCPAEPSTVCPAWPHGWSCWRSVPRVLPVGLPTCPATLGAHVYPGYQRC